MYTEAQRRTHIYDLQRFLRRIQREHGAVSPLAPDGIFGEETAAAVRQFQREHALPVTGKADLVTWTAIWEEYTALTAGDALPATVRFFPPARDTVLRRGDKGCDVATLQCMLNTLPLHFAGAPRVPPTGIYDEETERAIYTAQGFFLLPQTGETDRRTWQSLAAVHNAYHHRPPLAWLE